MVGLARIASLVAVVALALGLAACAGTSSSPSPSPTISAPLSELSALAEHYGAQQAWWMALSRAEADRLIDDAGWTPPSGSPGTPTPVYVVLVHGDFNDATGKPHQYEWAIVARTSDGSMARVMSDRPEVAGREWNPLPVSSPQSTSSQ
jgi:hypothetical protein